MRYIEYLCLWLRARRYLRKDEPDECQFACDIVKPGQHVIDIGAHKGAFTYWLSHSVGSDGCVYAFEPQRELAEQLQRFASMRRHRNVRVCPVALSDRRGRRELTVPRFTGWGTLEPCSRAEGCSVMEVPVETLDEYWGSIGAAEKHSIAFVKCDVELHELAVLRGSVGVLTSDAPSLLIESHSLARLAIEQNPTFEYLNRLGYVGYFFSAGQLIPICKYSSAQYPRRGSKVQNYVFLHPSRVSLLSDRHPFAVQRTFAAVRAA